MTDERLVVLYEIRNGKHAQCELVSLVTSERDCRLLADTMWAAKGTKYTNVVCEGTYEYCERIKQRMEAM